MIEANEVNSTFYALRMLSHRLETSEIEVTDGEEYPASEFTREEQEQALEIIHRIEDVESVPVAQLPPDKIDFYSTSLADRIEELTNSDLANAGYAAVESVREAILKGPRTREEIANDIRLMRGEMAVTIANLLNESAESLLTRELVKRPSSIKGLSPKIPPRVRKYQRRQGSKLDPKHLPPHNNPNPRKGT